MGPRAEPAPVDVLIPTCNRPAALAVTLSTLLGQTCAPLRLVVSDQGDEDVFDRCGELQAVLRLLRVRGWQVETHRHLPRRGMAEQRQFLLDQARAPHALFLDDDVLLESDLVERMSRALAQAQCGFVGSAVIGLSFLDDHRPHQQHVEFWDGRVQPERLAPGGAEWARHHLHSAANLWHVQQRMGVTPDRPRLYKVAWVGGCVMYDTARLREAGGYTFWRDLPAEHCGEDVLAQLRVMARFGGAGLMPSGAYHLEIPTTVRRRECDAPFALPQWLP